MQACKRQRSKQYRRVRKISIWSVWEEEARRETHLVCSPTTSFGSPRSQNHHPTLIISFSDMARHPLHVTTHSFSHKTSSRLTMARNQSSQTSQNAPASRSTQPQTPPRFSVRLPAGYPGQFQHQQELAQARDEESRLELAKAHHRAQTAAEREAQKERANGDSHDIGPERGGHHTNNTQAILASRPVAREVRSAANESARRTTRAQTKRAAQEAKTPPYDGEDEDERGRENAG
jgi:hypothetical protein